MSLRAVLRPLASICFKVADYENYFKESGITEETANIGGILAQAKGRPGFSSAIQANDGVYAAHRAVFLSN